MYRRNAEVHLLSALALIVLFLAGCGGTGTSVAGDRASITVTVSPASATMKPGESKQFTAFVTTADSSSVTWLVDGVQGGSSVSGVISASGLYTAPQISPSDPVIITAVSTNDPTGYGQATLTITANPAGPVTVTVSVSPASATMQTGESKQFTATVTGATNSSVIWRVNDIQGGNSAVGIISGSGLYTAPQILPSGPITITAVSTSDPTRSGQAMLTLTAAPPPPSSGQEFYVSTTGSDSNNGSFAYPWATIQHAANVVGPGAFVHVAPGTYFGPITTSISGTSSARVRFVSDTQGAANIRTSSSNAVWTNNGDYVDIEGFDIAGDSTSCLGIVNWASFVRIVGNTVHNIPAPGGCNGNGGAGIDNADFSASDNDIIGNVVHDIGDYTVPNPSVHGIYHSNLRGHIWNNLTYRNQGWGIHLWHAPTHVIVSSNTVFNNGYGGILIGADSIVDDFTLVANNIVVFNGRIGISEYGNTGTHNQYLNNLLYQNASGAFDLLNGLRDVGTIVVDPHFINYQPDGSGDYHLLVSSPAIGAGTCQGAPSIDFAGGARPQAGGCDIGAYQFKAPAGKWPW